MWRQPGVDWGRIGFHETEGVRSELKGSADTRLAVRPRASSSIGPFDHKSFRGRLRHCVD